MITDPEIEDDGDVTLWPVLPALGEVRKRRRKPLPRPKKG